MRRPSTRGITVPVVQTSSTDRGNHAAIGVSAWREKNKQAIEIAFNVGAVRRMRCQICLRDFAQLRFNAVHIERTARIKICRWCVEDLNAYRKVGSEITEILGERLRGGMEKRLDSAMKPDQDQKTRRKAMHEYNRLDEMYAERLPGWLNKIAAEKNGRSEVHKILRAHRRGLLHFDRPKSFKLPCNWSKIAREVRKRDKHTCMECGVSGGEELHVHHIVYRGNFGTNKKHNLITLCKTCHEQEHGSQFDIAESIDLQSVEVPPITVQEHSLEVEPSATEVVMESRSAEPVMTVLLDEPVVQKEVDKEFVEKKSTKRGAWEVTAPVASTNTWRDFIKSLKKRIFQYLRF